MRAQQRHSPRGSNGDRSKPSKAKEKKESKEGKEAAGKAKDDKVNNMLMVSAHHFLLHNITYIQTQLFALLIKHAACLPAAMPRLSFQFCVWEKPAHKDHIQGRGKSNNVLCLPSRTKQMSRRKK